MMIRTFTIIILLMLSSVSLARQGNDIPLGLDEETAWLLRLWTPEDIEEYAKYLAGRTGVNWKHKSDLTGIEGRTLNKLSDAYRTDAEMMRNAAYSVLINWPEGLDGLKKHALGAGYAYEQKPYGMDLLAIYWRAWSAEWHDLWQDSIDTSDTDLQRRLVENFEAKWGRLVPIDDQVEYIGRVPPYADGEWYMTIGEPDGKGLLAVVRKRGGYYGDWDNSNCYVNSFLFGKYKEMRGPFPNEMMLFNDPDNGKITLGEFVYSFIGPQYVKKKYTRVTWVPNADWAGTSRRNDAFFESEYPFWDSSTRKWELLPVKISYSEFDAYSTAKHFMEKLWDKRPREYGEYFRMKAGTYKRN